MLLLSIFILIGCENRPAPVVSLVAIDPPARPLPSFDTDVAPILDRYCVGCHQGGSPRNGIFLDGEAQAIDRVTWGRVADVLRSGSMPPKGRPSPDRWTRDRINEWINHNVFSCSVADQDPGRVTLRRLNQVEYDHTIRDLFGFDRELKLSATFPADDVGEGFDKIGDVLAIPPILMEKYLGAADQALDEAIRSPRIWSRVMNPLPDQIPLRLRKPTFAARNEPVKRIGRPEPVARVVVDPDVERLNRAQEIVRGFADRAFRRPATQAELTRLVGLVESALKEGDDLDQAIRFALKAVLVSPFFLFLVEDGSDNRDAKMSQPIDDFALAARLSYFLESGPPDDELARLAVLGELRRSDNLAKQVRRLLVGPRSRALFDGFFAQWLQIRALKEATPDPRRFPDFDEQLRQAMIEETCRFGVAILHEDRSVIDFLDADFTFVNERLARHYGIAGVVGPEFRRVSLKGSNRGGILGHASVLTVTSNPTRTSPVKRGKWVLDTLLGLPPLPPPEGVEGLNGSDGVVASRTIRQQMERHRLDPACASCHERMDPLGFGLENFDAIGAWRTYDEGQAIDASGTLPGGEVFSGPVELREILKARSDRFVRCLAEKMLTYALGRGLRPTDRCFVDAIVRQTRTGGDQVSSLVQAIVASPPFQNQPGRQIDP